MGLTHWMDMEEGTGGALVLSCPEVGCGRRVIISSTAEITVLDTGDFYSRHVAATGPLVVAADASA